LVTKIDHEGGKLEGPDAEIRKDETPNPKGSIQGRIITDGADRATPEEELPVFWPLFPYDIMPIKEGEHAYVIFEDNSNRTHGLWVTRIPESKKVDKLNLVPGEKKYEENKDNDYSDKAAQGTLLEVKQPKQSEEFAKEDVPDFTARIGDRAIHGSNNTLILLSRDRKDKPDSGEEKGAGSIFLIAGRKKKEEINIEKDGDDSVILISMKSEVDANFGIKDAKAGKDAKADASIVVRSNEIRISARTGMKIIVDKGDLYIKADGKVTVEAEKEIMLKTKDKLNVEASSDITLKSNSKVTLDCNQIEVGTGGEKAVKGETLVGILADVVQGLMTDIRPSAMGPVAPAGSLGGWISAFGKLKSPLPLSMNVKIK
jgi:hypothetical protein